jgi:hypothetical protein
MKRGYNSLKAPTATPRKRQDPPRTNHREDLSRHARSQLVSLSRKYNSIASGLTNYTGSLIIVDSDSEDEPLGNKESGRVDKRGLKYRLPQYNALRDGAWLNTRKDAASISACRSPTPLPADVEQPRNLSSSDQAPLELTHENVAKIPQCSRRSFSIPTEDVEESTATLSGCGISCENRKRLLNITSGISEHLHARLKLEDELKGINSQISEHCRAGLKLKAALSVAFKQIGDVPL